MLVAPPVHSRLPYLEMPKIPPTVQRLILAFTTGLFLACAAGVSGQSGGLSSVMSAQQ